MNAATPLVFLQLSKKLVLVATSMQIAINNNVASDLETLRIVMFLEKPQQICKNKTQCYSSALLTLRVFLNLVFDLPKPN